MKIITWNCNMAFRKKAAAILAMEPDILVIPECESTVKLVFDEGLKQPSSALWFGDNLHKGLAVLAYNGLELKLIGKGNPAIKTVAPIAVTGKDVELTLFAIWANNPQDPDGQYVTQVWKAIHHYKRLIKRERTLLLGDFNSNTIWDRPRRIGNHSDVVKYLKRRNISSAYHHHHGQQHGAEEHPTFYLYRHLDKPYHLDYCFVSADIANQLQSVEIGDHAVWTPYSDHVPLTVTFNIDSVYTNTGG
jgi:exonuclease III